MKNKSKVMKLTNNGLLNKWFFVELQRVSDTVKLSIKHMNVDILSTNKGRKKRNTKQGHMLNNQTEGANTWAEIKILHVTFVLTFFRWISTWVKNHEWIPYWIVTRYLNSGWVKCKSNLIVLYSLIIFKFPMSRAFLKSAIWSPMTKLISPYILNGLNLFLHSHLEKHKHEGRRKIFILKKQDHLKK